MRGSNLPNTIGLEFESIVNSRDEISRYLTDELNFGKDENCVVRQVTRDASVESKFGLIGKNSSLYLGRKSLRDGLKRYREDHVGGFEIVTRPLDYTEVQNTIIKTMNAILRAGEVFSPRSSIHVHVGFPSGFIFLKTAMALGLKVEPLLYKIAGMGLPYRGEINHSAYARALAHPPAIQTNRGETVILDPAAARDAKDYYLFWNHLGIMVNREYGRYVPIRYFGINVYSTLLRGTMEYRFFNFSKSSLEVFAVTRLCQFLTELMVKAPLEAIASLYDVSIFKRNVDRDYMILLSDLVSLGDHLRCDFALSKEELDCIEGLIYKTPQPVFKEEAVLTHLATYIMDNAEATSLGLRRIGKAIPPGTVDIHNFGERDHTLLGA